MSTFTEKLTAQYTLAQIQDQAKKFGIKNVKKFTKDALAAEIEKTVDAASAANDKTKEQDMNVNTEAVETVEVTPIVGNPDELIALLNGTTDEPIAWEPEIEADPEELALQAEAAGIPVITEDEVAGILEDSVADVPGENETEVAPKLTDEYIAMLDEVRANAAKRKHVMWNQIIAKADNEPLAQIAGKANTVRGILWKIGKHLEPMIAAVDEQEAIQAKKAADEAAAAAEIADEIAAVTAGE